MEIELSVLKKNLKKDTTSATRTTREGHRLVRQLEAADVAARASKKSPTDILAVQHKSRRSPSHEDHVERPVATVKIEVAMCSTSFLDPLIGASNPAYLAWNQRMAGCHRCRASLGRQMVGHK